MRFLALHFVASLLIQSVSPSFAQSGAQSGRAGEASLRVVVIDPKGAAVSRANITLVSTAKSDHSRTSGIGEAVFSKTPPGQVQLRVEAKGFAVWEQKIEVRQGVNSIEVTLDLAKVEEELSVGQDKREASTDPRGNAFSTVLTAEQIAQLPDDPDELENVIREMAGPGASLRVNGFRGGKLPPKSQIREIRFRMNPYAAENHEAGHIMVDITTKPGIDLWHGSFNGAFRDESLNARNPAAAYRGDEQTRRFAFDLGGPLWKNRTSLFLSADGADEFDSKTIVAELPTGRVNEQITRPNRRLNVAARAEHALNKTHTLRGEYQRNATRRDNLGAGDFDLPERAYASDGVESLVRVADSGSLGKALFNEFRFQSRWLASDIDSLVTLPTTIVQNSFARGGAQFENSRRTREIEVADNVDFILGNHSLRAGFLFETERIQSNELRNRLGTFTFGSLEQFNAGRPITFTRRVGDGRVEFDQQQLGWYVQDDVKLRKSLTLSFGVRHEFQTTETDRNNFAPRLGIAWSPFKDGKTTFRFGAGIFYDWFAAEVYEQTLRVDGVKQVDEIIQNPGFPIPSSGSDAIVLPPSRIQTAAHLEQPTIYQASFSVERQLPASLMLRANYTYQRGLHLLRGRNVNAPFADGTRPVPSLGNVTQIESSANSFSHSLNININWARPSRVFLGANYVLSRVIGEVDGPTSLPVNNRDLRAERGPALFDARHRFFLFSNFTVWRGLRIGASFQANTATPYNITTGFDDNRDTVINDRPAGISRNSARGVGRHDLSVRLSYGTGWGQQRESAANAGPQVRILRGGDAGEMLGSMGGLSRANTRYRMEFYTQAFNVLNHGNPIGFSGVMTSPFFGLPTAALPGRRLEVGMRFSW